MELLWCLLPLSQYSYIADLTLYEDQNNLTNISYVESLAEP